MKILQLCHKVPYPPVDGGCKAMNNLTEGFISEGENVKVLALNTKKHHVDIKQLPSAYRMATGIETIDIDTEVRPGAALLNLFTGGSYNVQRFYSKDFERKIEQVLRKESFEIIQLESIYLGPYISVIRKNSKAPLFLRTHNVEHRIWERLAAEEKNILKRFYLKLLATRLKDEELEYISKCDGILTITNNDAELFKNFGYRKPIVHIPFALNINDYPIEEKVKEINLFHLGSMDWMPNTEGIKWFLENVWSEVNKKFPELKFHIAGKGMSPWFKNLQLPNVIIDGEVKDSNEYLRSKKIMVVPLFSGGGMRVKIIEGMAFGKTIISTSIGAEGIAYEKNRNILIGDTVNEFVDQISKCMNDAALVDNIGTNARALIESRYNTIVVTKELLKFYENQLKT